MPSSGRVAALMAHAETGVRRSFCAVLAYSAWIFLVGCVSEPIRDVERDGAPSVSPSGLERLPDPIVRDEAQSRTGNGPYEVFGQSYTVMSSARGYSAEGNASWYGTKFHGRTTSSGEPYDMFQLTAAHRSLPIPTFARVTNLNNNKTTIVRVNDRGPFHPDRIIDLSYAAAMKLGFTKEGTARVLVEAVSERDFAPAGHPEPVITDLTLGPFASLDDADGILAEVRGMLDVEGMGSKAGVARRDGEYFVRVGPIQSRQSVERLRAVLAFHEREIPVVIEE